MTTDDSSCEAIRQGSKLPGYLGGVGHDEALLAILSKVSEMIGDRAPSKGFPDPHEVIKLIVEQVIDLDLEKRPRIPPP